MTELSEEIQGRKGSDAIRPDMRRATIAIEPSPKLLEKVQGATMKGDNAKSGRLPDQ